MTIQITPIAVQVYKALGDFLAGVLPGGADAVFVAQTNRVPETTSGDFVMMNMTGQERLSTNVDDYADAFFTGSIAGNVLTITAVSYGAIDVGSPVLGVGVAANTFVTALGTGTGGVGTYTVNNAQTVASGGIACGVTTKLQPMQVSVQLDVHGDAGYDNAVLITTLFRDEYGVNAIQASGFDVTPLYCSDARQIPFTNENQQIEQRWVIDAQLQVNPIFSIPQEFADEIALGVVSVDAVYPPGPPPPPPPAVGGSSSAQDAPFVGVMRYDVAQLLSPSQKSQAQQNIGVSGSGVNAFLATIAELRSLDSLQYSQGFVNGYWAPGDGGGGSYWFDASDHTSHDNGGTIIVGLNGARWKLVNYGFINVRQFGAKGDKITDDSASIQAAVNAAVNGSCWFPPGCYLGSGITVKNCELIGLGGKDSVLPYGVTGAVIWVTDTTKSAFLLGRGAIVRNLAFYYPNQDGSTITDASNYPTFVGAPITYPPTIQTSHPAGAGASAIQIIGCTGYNVYDFISLGDGSAVVGRVLIEDCEAFALNKFLRVRHATGLIELKNTFASVAVFQSVALVGDQKLGKWAQFNSTFLETDDVSGIQVQGGIAYGFRKGWIVATDKTSQSVFSGFHFDSTPIALSLEGVGFLNATAFIGTTFYCQDRYSNVEDLAAFQFASSPTLTVDNEMCFLGCAVEATQGHAVSITSDCMRKFSWLGGRIKGWGTGPGLTGKCGVFRSDGAGVVILSTMFENTSTGGIAFQQTAGFKAFLHGCDFDNCQRPIDSSAGGSLLVTNNSANNSVLASRTAATQVLTHHAFSNVYEGVVRGTRPAFYVQVTSAQVFNSNVPTVAQFANEVFDRGGNFDPTAFQFTAPISGEYELSLSLGHDATATPGDVWKIRVVNGSDAMVSQYRVPSADNLTVSFGGTVEMLTGQVAYVDVARVSGSGNFVTQADGTVNRFQGRLIE